MQNLPFTALRVFEAVARLRGFNRAAEELGVTQSSVSQHVKALEEWMGRKLLIRSSHNTVATEDGQQLAEAISSGLGKIIEVCNHLKKRRSNEQMIVLSCPPGFALNWLFPRLINFDQSHPDLPVSITTSSLSLSIPPEDTSLSIRYGTGKYPNLVTRFLMPERICPVCSPELLAGDPPLDQVSDLARHTVLLDELGDHRGNPPTWSFWAEKAGVVLPRLNRTRRFGQANMSVQAAIKSSGVALGREPLVIDAVSEGKLVFPFPTFVGSEYGYWLVCNRHTAQREHMQIFMNWLEEEVAALPDMAEYAP
ncbi:MAG: LysR substrate-binding domain-containing protein [Alphaproteobacteria bacterium]|nr:LysR substrate-binding domain-containing protein [Alphaproteobacteria bacterium]